MNRKIKFRAWDKNKMVEWDKLKRWWFKVAEDKDTVFMQFTGLLDCNGKEIYEGDMVRTEAWNKLRVEWDYDQWGLFDGICNEASIDENVEVIGNIYENPEL